MPANAATTGVSPFKQRLLERTQTAQADAGTLDTANPDGQTAPATGIRESILSGVDAAFQENLTQIQNNASSRGRLRSGVTSNEELGAARTAAQNRIAQIGQFEAQEADRRERLIGAQADIEAQGEQARLTVADQGTEQRLNIVKQGVTDKANITEQNAGTLAVAEERSAGDLAATTQRGKDDLATAKAVASGNKAVAVQQGLNTADVAKKQAAGSLAVANAAATSRETVATTQKISAKAVADAQAQGALAVEQERSRISEELTVINNNLQRELATGQIETAVPTVQDAEVLVDSLNDAQLAEFMDWPVDAIPPDGWSAEERQNIAKNIFNTRQGSVPVESLQSKQIRLQKSLAEMKISADIEAASALGSETRAQIREASEERIKEIEAASTGRIAELEASGASALEIEEERSSSAKAVAEERSAGQLAAAKENNAQIIASQEISAKMQTDIAVAASTERTSIAEIAKTQAISLSATRAIVDNALIASNERVQMENLNVEDRKVAVAEADQESRANINLHQMALADKAQAFGEKVTKAQVTGMWEAFGPQQLTAMEASMGSSFGDENYDGASDLDGDGTVDFKDFLAGAALAEVGGVTTLQFQQFNETIRQFDASEEQDLTVLDKQIEAQASESGLSRKQEASLAALALSTSTAMQEANLDFQQLQLIADVMASPVGEGFTDSERSEFLDSVTSTNEARTWTQDNPKIAELDTVFAELPEFMTNALQSMGVESPEQYMEWVSRNFADMDAAGREEYVKVMDFNDDGIVDNEDLLIYYGG
jgi:hypothetical protein